MNYLKSCLKACAKLDLNISFDDLPHTSLRFVGYSPKDRQTLSIPKRSARLLRYAYVEAGDPSPRDAGFSLAHASRSLGRRATESDLVELVKRRQGCRSMRGVTGDVFSSKTWLMHASTSLRERGLLTCGPDGKQSTGLQFCVLASKLNCLTARMAEAASQKGELGLERLPMNLALPGTYSALEADDAAGGNLRFRRGQRAPSLGHEPRRQVNGPDELCDDFVMPLPWAEPAAPAAKRPRARADCEMDG